MFQKRKSVLARIERLKKRNSYPKAAENIPTPHRLKPIPGKVLHEEDYVKHVEKIIQRDYYPDLPRLRATQKLFKAKEERNPQQIAIARRNLECLTPATGAATPSVAASPFIGGDKSVATPLIRDDQSTATTPFMRDDQSVATTPLLKDDASMATPFGDDASVASGTAVLNIQERRKGEVVTLVDGRELLLDVGRTRLDTFQSIFTSEDNESFEKIMTEEKRLLTLKEAWIENAAKCHNHSMLAALKDHISMDDETLALTDGSACGDSSQLLFTAAEPRNALLFAPHPPGSELAIQQAERKVISNKNTRFPTSLQDSDVLLQKQREKFQMLAQRDADEQTLSTMVERGEFAEHGDPVRGFGFEKTPVIEPGVGPDASPLMTWGEVASTPLLLSQHDMTSSELIGGPQGRPGFDDRGWGFLVQDQPQKELAAHRLAERMTKNNTSSRDRQRRNRILFSKLGDIAAREASSRRSNGPL